MLACRDPVENWILHELPSGVLELSLNQAHFERYKRWKKRRIPQQGVPGFHPVNLSLVNGHISNVKVYLRYGFNLEFSKKFYNRLVEVVAPELICHSRSQDCVFAVQNKPNQYQKRFFLILLVIHVYIKAEKFPNEFQGCDEALQTIWSHNPSSFLCRVEFLSVLSPFDTSETVITLSRFYKRYCARVSMSSGLIQPFSLAHHCRCKVREMMGSNTLPHGVHDLPIPDKLKRYLWFQ